MEHNGQPVTVLKAVNLEKFELAVYAGEHEKATQELFHVLKALHTGNPFEGYDSLGQSEFTRIASGVVALFSHPKFVFSQRGFNLIASEYPMLDAVFKASAFGDSTHAFRLITDATEGLNKYLVLFALDSAMPFDLEAAIRKDPQATSALYFAMLGHWMVFSEKADERRNMLIRLTPIFEDIDLDPMNLNVLCMAYMHVSYAGIPEKHQPKRLIHKLMAKMMAPEVPVGPLIRKEKPTILMPLEWWWTHHVMYRDFGKPARALKDRFRLVGMARKDNTNEEARSMFDEFIEVGDPVILQTCAEEIRKRNPDIVYYPSLGMSVWTVAMASLRLAPIQVLTFGHPATSMSPVMDYGIAFDGYEGPQELFSEKIVTLPHHFQRHVYNKPAKIHVPTRGAVVKIGIPAMQAKVSWPFIKALKDIQEKAGREVQFVFLPPVSGLLMWQFGRQIVGELKNSLVCDKATNQQYLAWLSECDIALFGFPFGGSNSTIDAMLCGVPMVGMMGPNIHECMDGTLIRRAGLPEWLVAKTHEEYVNAVVRLMDDDVRYGVAARVREINVEQTFCQPAPEAIDAFVQAFSDIYDRHAMEQAA